MEQRKTPLLDAIVDYTTNRPVYFKIPGHRYEKGISPRWRQWTGDGIFRFDLTEAEGLDDLHEPEGVIREAQELAAEVFQAKKTYFLVNGTTCGNEAMVLASVKEGEKIMVARNAHKSVLMGLTLSGAVPVYLMPKQDPVTGLWGSLDPETVEEGFRQYPDCKAVFLVSPTYYGVCAAISVLLPISATDTGRCFWWMRHMEVICIFRKKGQLRRHFPGERFFRMLICAHRACIR